MKKIFSAIAVLTAFATAAVSCSDDDTKDDEKIPVAEVKVTPATGSVVAGTTLTLKAEILPENASDKTVEWRSRTPEIATVDPETGVVTGVAEGEAEILALCGGKNGKAVITVKAKDQTALIRAQKCHQIFQTVTNLMNTFSFIFSLINGHSAVPPHSAGMLQFHNITDILLIIPYDVPRPPADLHPAQESDQHP